MCVCMCQCVSVCACACVCPLTQHVQCSYGVGLEGLDRVVHVVLWGGRRGKMVDLIHCESRGKGGGEGRGKGSGEEEAEKGGKGGRNDAQTRKRTEQYY